MTTSASLRIFTDESSLSFVSSALQIPPSVQHLKGEHRSKRNPKSSVFEQSVWIYRSPLPRSVELSEHLEQLLSLLELKRQALKAIRRRVTSVDIFCMFSSESGQGSMELDALLLQRLAKQQIDVTIDLYPPSEAAGWRIGAQSRRNPRPAQTVNREPSAPQASAK